MQNSNKYSGLKKKINLFLDDQLDGGESQSLLKMVDDDPKCCSIYNKEKDFRDFIKSNISRPSVSKSLLQSIKQNIASHPEV
jgi:F0F1-type ATP synthase delta subunit